MIPLPVNPTVVVQIDQNNNVGTIKHIASNIDKDLNVVVVNSDEEFEEASKGKPFKN